MGCQIDPQEKTTFKYPRLITVKEGKFTITNLF